MNITSDANKLENILPSYVVVIGSFISIMTLATNATLLVALGRSKASCKEKPATIYLVALLTTHLIVGVASFVILPGLTIVNASNELVRLAYEISGYLFRFLFAVIYCLLIAMLADRMLAVKKPFMYQNFTWVHAVKTLPLVVLCPCLYLIILLVNYKGTAMACVFLYSATGSFIVIGNAVIFIEVKNQLNQIKQLSPCIQPSSTTSPTTTLTTAPNCDTSTATTPFAIYQKSFKRKLQKSIMVSLLFSLSFIICWTPYSLKTFVDFINDAYKEYMLQNTNLPLSQSLFILGISNSILDPFVYVMLNRPVRKAILNTMKCFKKNGETVSVTSKITSPTHSNEHAYHEGL